ncbi:MAG: 3-methyl-2-oxobutanoate dehydrogenase subunit beta [Planctomycetota bacterium]|nr:3-methyl-2-oxobutanoate dehydrogenase subunit beta [Planctomycetota bacterium]MDI6787942.1 3-methyl-2-oxobutanoate dehydrogenase subunit beta [Planctomycetota bacterium]
MKFTIPQKEYMYSGHFACPGCGGALAMRLALKALGPKTMIVLPACCWSIINGPFPYSAVSVPLFHTAFETAASVSSGVKAALDVLGKKDITVLAWAGDGGTFDIGLQALSGAAERNDDFIYVCYDNEAYMNTGIQRSSATPWGAWTTTTPLIKEQPKKNIMEIILGHHIPYAATATVSFPDDFIRKISKAKKIKGTRFIHALVCCPPGWRCSSEQSIKLTRLAVQSGIFPLYEIEKGKYNLNKPRGIPADDKLIRLYLNSQGRFFNLTEKDIKKIIDNIKEEWFKLQHKLAP